jgi:hypothetical protein
LPIEDWISDPIASERHERVVAASPERAIELALEIPAGGDPFVGTLLRMRGMKRGGTMEDFFEANGFVFLARRPREIVLGLGAPVWTPRNRDSGERLHDAADWAGWSEPCSIKAAATFSAEPAGEGSSTLVTETQVDATDDAARRAFRRYWLVVEPFSRLIRRRWLRQVAKRAERE